MNQFLRDSVDGGYPAPVDMEKLPLFTGFSTSQMVQDFWTINSSINHWFSLMNHLKMLHLLLNMVIFQLAMLVFWLLTIKKYQESLNKALFPLKMVGPVEVSS